MCCENFPLWKSCFFLLLLLLLFSPSPLLLPWIHLYLRHYFLHISEDPSWHYSWFHRVRNSEKGKSQDSIFRFPPVLNIAEPPPPAGPQGFEIPLLRPIVQRTILQRSGFCPTLNPSARGLHLFPTLLELQLLCQSLSETQFPGFVKPRRGRTIRHYFHRKVAEWTFIERRKKVLRHFEWLLLERQPPHRPNDHNWGESVGAGCSLLRWSRRESDCEEAGSTSFLPWITSWMHSTSSYYLLGPGLSGEH